MGKKIAVFGHTTLDFILFLEEGHLHQIHPESTELCVPFPSKLSVKRRVVSLGGNAPNVGVTLARSDHHVVLVSQVGIGPLGNLLYQELLNEGFDLVHLSRDGDTDSSVILSHGGDRTILAYHNETRYSFPADINQVDWIYLTSLGFSDFHNFHHDLLSWLSENDQVGLIYNPGRTELERGFDSVEGVMRTAHTVILNLQEAQQLLGMVVKDQLVPVELIQLLEIYVRKGVKRIVVTDGVNGAYYCDGLDRFYHIATIREEVVDSTGAGDAFSGGYMLALVGGEDPQTALRFGIAQASHVVTQAGATHGLLTIDQLRTRVSSHPKTKAQLINLNE